MPTDKYFYLGILFPIVDERKDSDRNRTILLGKRGVPIKASSDVE